MADKPVSSSEGFCDATTWDNLVVMATIVLVGGTGWLGTALARRLAKRKARMAVTYLIPEEATRFEEELDLPEERLLLRRVDATQPEELESFFKEARAQFDEINGACSLVGAWAGGRDVEETDDVRFDRMLDLNLRSAFYTARAAIPHLKEAAWGRLLLVSSRAIDDAPSGQAAFNAAKAGVMALTRSIATELRHTNVSANALMPSVIDTPATREAIPYADYVDWPSPEEIAPVAEFLLSEAAGVVTGAAVPVSGRT